MSPSAATTATNTNAMWKSVTVGAPPRWPSSSALPRSESAPSATPRPMLNCVIVLESVFAPLICACGTSANEIDENAVNSIERNAPPTNSTIAVITNGVSGARERARRNRERGEDAVPQQHVAKAEALHGGRRDRLGREIAREEPEQQQARRCRAQTECELEHQRQQERHAADGEPVERPAENAHRKRADVQRGEIEQRMFGTAQMHRRGDETPGAECDETATAGHGSVCWPTISKP